MFCLLKSQIDACEPNPKTTSSDWERSLMTSHIRVGRGVQDRCYRVGQGRSKMAKKWGTSLMNIPLCEHSLIILSSSHKNSCTHTNFFLCPEKFASQGLTVDDICPKKNREITQENWFLVGFSHLEPLCAGAASSPCAHIGLSAAASKLCVSLLFSLS